MSSVALRAESGRELGSSASRRLRREGKVPAVLYGHGTDPLSLAVDHREFVLSMRGEAGRNTIFALELDGKTHTALATEIERHPFRDEVRHVDFLIVDLDEVVSTNVPIQGIGEAPGLKEGGILDWIRPTVQIEGVVSKLPSEIELDLSEMELGSIRRIGDLPEIDGVEYTNDEELTVVSMVTPRGLAEEEEEDLDEDEELLEGEEAEEATETEE
jgi:large subunit ribosomal protein L25